MAIRGKKINPIKTGLMASTRDFEKNVFIALKIIKIGIAKNPSFVKISFGSYATNKYPNNAT